MRVPCGASAGRTARPGISSLLPARARGAYLQEQAVLAGPSGRFRARGKTIATAGSDHRARVWDAATLTLRHEWDLQCHVVAAVFGLDGRHLITGNGNNTLTIFRLAPYTATAAK